MLMIGVIPLPALMNSSFAGGKGSGSTNVPSTPPSLTIVPGRTPAEQERRDLAAVDELGGDRDAAVGALGVGGQRVGAPVVHAVDLDPQPQVLPGPCAAAIPSRA